MRRVWGIAACIGTHLLFAFTVWHLFWFLKGPLPGETGGTLWIDLALAFQFVVPHSALLHPTTRESLSEYIPAPFYGLMFCSVTCLGLLATILLWQPLAHVWWRFEGPARTAIDLAFYGSWGMLVYSIKLAGFGYQTGWTPWSYWLHGEPVPPRKFQPRSLYLRLRHPVYLGFLGLIWFTPVMTADRAVLAGVWTVYIFVGSHLKDQRLLYYLGDRYREYQAEVPGYPGVFTGPLARIPYQPVRTAAPQPARRAA